MNNTNIWPAMTKAPLAAAHIKGSPAHPDIHGTAAFYKVRAGVLVAIEVYNLPGSNDKCKKPIYAAHIHSGSSCTGNETDPFADAMAHYNPANCAHPYHAGDMPPLFSSKGFGFMAFLTDRFTIEEIIGKTIIIHSNPDDFTTQPSGNSGAKIACGTITRI